MREKCKAFRFKFKTFLIRCAANSKRRYFSIRVNNLAQLNVCGSNKYHGIVRVGKKDYQRQQINVQIKDKNSFEFKIVAQAYFFQSVYHFTS